MNRKALFPRGVLAAGGAFTALLSAAVLIGCTQEARTGELAGGSADRSGLLVNTQYSPDGENRTSRTPAPPAVQQTPAIRDAAAMQNAFAQVAKAAEPTVVTITTTRRMPPRSTGEGPGGLSPFRGPSPFGDGPGGEDPFEEFFRRFRDFGFGPGVAPAPPQGGSPFRPTQSVPMGLGSGFVYDEDGLIITNAHVVRGADTVTVKLSDGREFKNAKVLGADDRTDVAVVKIDATGLTALPLGDSSGIRVGDWAIAIGNPFGLEHTLTVGVVSAKAREVPLNVASPGDYIQTDASINRGNSGGPLLDIYGRVIGVNNAIYSPTGGSVGIGFAIPINTAREIAEILAKEGHVRRAQLGIGISDVEDRGAAFGLSPDATGVLVEHVEPNGPAAQAGLQPGDVITRFNDQPVTRSAELQRQVSRAQIGSTVKLTVLRGGKTVTLDARLTELKTEGADGARTRPQPDSAPEGGAAEPTTLGIRLGTLTPELAQRYGVRAERGVVIAGVENGSPAAAAGLRPGDVIERVGQTMVSTPQEVQRAVKGILDRQSGDAKSVALYVNRRGERQFVIVPVGS